jgi:beta-phosphoglucomutase-like phosphatase (HAD superfamily)
MKLGAIFDWDGVIVDSSSHHEESWERLAKETGFTLPEGHFRRGFGMKNEFIIPNLLNWSNRPPEIRQLSLRKEELYREILLEWGIIRSLPGVIEWLTAFVGIEAAHRGGMKVVAVATTNRIETLKTADLAVHALTSSASIK